MTELKSLDELLEPAYRKYKRPKIQASTFLAFILFSGITIYINELSKRIKSDNRQDDKLLKQIQLIQNLRSQKCQQTEHEINCQTHTIIPQAQTNQSTSLSILDSNQKLQTTFHWQYPQTNKFLIEVNDPKQYFWCSIDNQTLICHNQNKQKFIHGFSQQNHPSSLLNIQHESNNRTRQPR